MAIQKKTSKKKTSRKSVKKSSGKNKSVLIVELLHHHECLEALIDFYLKKNYHVDLALGDYVYQKINSSLEKYDLRNVFVLEQPFRKIWLKYKGLKRIPHFAKEAGEISGNIQRVRKIVLSGKYDCLHANTINNIFLLPLMKFCNKNPLPCRYTVHNTDLSLGLKKGLLANIVNYWNIKIFKKADGIFYLSEFLSIEGLSPEIAVYYVNNRITEKNPYKKSKKVSFVIPGKVDLALKDYEFVFRALSTLLHSGIQKKSFTLYLLGRLFSSEIIDMIKRYGLEDYVVYYESFLPESDYKKIFMQSHYCIIPLYPGSVYGKYKISGGHGDAAAWNVPLLVPDAYGKGHAFGKNVTKYRDEKEFIEILKKSL